MYKRQLIKLACKLDCILRKDTDPGLMNKISQIARMNFTFKLTPAKARMYHNRPRFNESYILQAYYNLIIGAEKEILIENAYFIPRSFLRDALRSAAKKGVRVVILTNSTQTNDLPQVSQAARYFYNDLLRVNTDSDAIKNGGKIEIIEWTGKNNKLGTLHSKFMVVDGEYGFVGSYNLDPRSQMLNNESGIAFQSKQHAKELRDLFNEDTKQSNLIKDSEAKNFTCAKSILEQIGLSASLWAKDWF